MCNAEIFKFNANYVVNKYWQSETKKEKKYRKQPDYQTWHELYPEVFRDIKKIIGSTLNLSLTRDTYQYKGQTRLLPIIHHDKVEWKKTVYEMIRKNGLRRSPDNAWTNRHTLSLWCYLSENDCQILTKPILQKICQYFNGTFDIDFMYDRAHALGADWRKCN